MTNHVIIWKPEIPFPKVADLKKIKTKITCIKPFEPEKDGYIFLHGLAIARHKGKLYCSWAHNKVRENSPDEEVNFSVSEDGGKTWSTMKVGPHSPKKGTAVSHGAFLSLEDKLWFFAPHFEGQLGLDSLKMAAYFLDDRSEKFVLQGTALDERFWPVCEPVLLDTGNYIMPGMYVVGTFNPENTAAVAISHGKDLMHWDMVKIEKDDDSQVWGECTLLVKGGNIMLYCRDEAGNPKVLVSESHDYGKTWSRLTISNMPMINSKPYAGTLSDGRHFLLSTCAADLTDRYPLTIALTEKDGFLFEKVYSIRDGFEPGLGDTCRMQLSYPYAIELDKKLYIVYSVGIKENRNKAEIAIIDIRNLY